MSLTINIVGQGTVQQQATPISHSFVDEWGYPETYTGTAYTVTANPSAGWSFDGWHLEFDLSTWYTGSSPTIYPQSADSNANPWSSDVTTDISQWSSLTFSRLYEGEHTTDYSATYGYTNVSYESVSNIVLTAKFKRNPIPNGPILRSDAGVILRSDAGVIMRQG